MKVITAKCEDQTRSKLRCGRDHQLLLVQLRHKIKRANAPQTRYDVDIIPDHFTVEVKNRFLQLLKTEEKEQTPNELWEDMEDISRKKPRNTSHLKEERTTMDFPIYSGPCRKKKEAKADGNQTGVFSPT